MDAGECRTADWRAIGFEDGAEGRSVAQFGDRRKACAEHGVTADFDAYLAGRVEGLGHYCRPVNGYRLGAEGQPYTGVCPVELDAAFQAAHADGHGLWERRARLERVRSELRRSRARAREIEQLLAERTARLIAPELDAPERATIAVELKQLTEDRLDLERAIDRLEQDQVAVETDYEDYRRRLAQRRGG
jgi:hypothetical protein